MHTTPRPALFLSLCTLGTPLVWAPASVAQYTLDDGSGGSNIGPAGFNANMMWGNYFFAQPGEETITGIDISFTTALTAGLPVTLFVFNDPDNDLDPRNADLLASIEVRTEETTASTFASYAFPATEVSGGFFVAAAMDLSSGQAAARMDGSTNAGRSWTFFDGPVLPEALGASALIYAPNGTNYPGTIANPFGGVYMLRATAVPAPGAGALLLGGVWRLRRRRR